MIVVRVREHAEYVGFDRLGVVVTSQLAVLAGEPRLDARLAEGSYYYEQPIG